MSQDAIRLLWTLTGSVMFVASVYLLAIQFRSLESRRVLRAVLVISPLLPAFWMAAFYAFVGRAWLHLGYRPYMYHPDPKTLGFDLHHSALWLGLVPCHLAPLVWLAAALVAWRVGNQRPVIARTAPAIAASYGIFLLLFYVDPGNFAEWFAD